MAHGPSGPTFTQNKGQWPAHVQFRALIPGGVLFVEDDALTYVLHRGGPAHHGNAAVPVQAHAFRVRFEGAHAQRAEAFAIQPGYANYFIGNDPDRWGTRCSLSQGVLLHDLYPGITLRIDGRHGLKYDLLVAPGADVSQVRMHYEGQDRLVLDEQGVTAHTSVGHVRESPPVAFQRAEGDSLPVPCRFRRHADRISFELPQGHDPTLPLTIDPIITFGSYSGSTADNFGFTASYDEGGHLYGAGIVFNIGYPLTVGVLQPSWMGAVDIGVSKWTPDGSSLVWSTYLGGNRSDTPHSLVVNSNDELYILGATGSSDLPVTANVVGPTFQGGPAINQWEGVTSGYGFLHPFGCDILLAHLSADATSLIGCTYVGGTGNDGVNNVADLAYNYGDAFRGEIALDALERPVIATSTQSSDIFMTADGAQITYGGGAQDAYLARFSPDLTSGQATYYGGSGADSGFGVQFASNGLIYLTGATTSSDLMMAGNPHDATYNGQTDGFVAAFADGGLGLFASTFVGTPDHDESYFVQLNTSDEVYLVGQTRGNFPVTPGKYANPGSSQFIQKFNAGLTTSLWSTVIGSGAGTEDISPSAFLVSDCGQIYFSGWGGETNHYGVATASTTSGLPVSPDAYQPNTNGSDFYLMVLEPEAVALNYATFFGGGLSKEHVDGGTSRFDKRGHVYQAVCAGCGNLDDFPTTPGAWSATNGSNNCNLGVFKFDLVQIISSIDIDGPHYVCLPDGTAQFLNLSVGGSSYHWDFGDGSLGSTEEEPSHDYTEPGLYTIRMILSDNDPCTHDDTTYVTLAVVDPLDAAADTPPVLCPNGSTQLHARGGHAYLWYPSTGLDDPTSADPIVTVDDSDMLYHVVVTDSCGNDTVPVQVIVGTPDIGLIPDTVLCFGSSVVLYADGGATYTWTPPNTLSDPTAAQTTATPTDTTIYHVSVVTADGCPAQDSVLVVVQFGPPQPVVTDTAICPGGQAHLHVSGADHVVWGHAGAIDPYSADQVVSPLDDTYYTVTLRNTCGTVVDSGLVEVRHVEARAWPDTLVCPGSPVTLHASGGVQYQWSPTSGLSIASGEQTIATVHTATTFQVSVINDIGCEGSASVHLSLYPEPSVQAGADVSIDFGHSTALNATGNGSMHWMAHPTLSCDSCPSPLASPMVTTTYTVELIDANGCRATDEVTVFINGSLWVPNTFSPNGDDINDAFFALATEVKHFRLLVFDRWGLEVFRADRPNMHWDGTFNGRPAAIDTYVWRVDLTHLNGQARTVYGHVNLVR